MPATLSSRDLLRLLGGLSLPTLAAALVAACGGGAGSTDSVSSATAVYARGAISGLGSIIVNGVRYDDSTATISDADGLLQTRAALQPGVEVELSAGPVSCSTDSTGTERCRAQALQIGFAAGLVGPIDLSSLTADHLSFSVLGQQVQINADTALDPAGFPDGPSDLAAGQVVEVHGILDRSSGQAIATRIELKNQAAQDGSFRYRLRGVLSEFDAQARTATIGGEALHFEAGVDLGTLANGQLLRVRIVPPAADASAAEPWQVDQLRSAEVLLAEHQDLQAELEGLVSELQGGSGSSASFKVGTATVSVNADTLWRGAGGRAALAELQAGDRVEVKGTVGADGVLAVRRIELRPRQQPRGTAREVEFHGRIDTLDPVSRTFVLRGQTFDYSAPLPALAGLTLAQLDSGNFTSKVEVRGVRSADLTRINVIRIKIEQD